MDGGHPGGGCGTILTRPFSAAALRQGFHRLDLRADLAILDPRDDQVPAESPTACGFFSGDDTLHRSELPPELSRSKVVWRESRPLAGITFGISSADSGSAAHFELAARHVSVRTFDERLPDLPLDEWLDIELRPWKTESSPTYWYVHDCRDETSGRAPEKVTLASRPIVSSR